MESIKKGITVVGVEATNFHRLSFAHVELVPGQGLVRVTGKNGAGKTSLLRSIRAALGGAGEVLPESVNSESEDKTGSVKLTLSNGFTVTRRFTEANPKGYLTVEGADGGKHTQAKLAEWLGPLSFDPLAFFDLKPERQREILLALGGDVELPTKLDALRSARAAKYEERTPWISTKRRASQVAKPTGERPAPVDISAELGRMGQLQKTERERQDLIRETEKKRDAAAARALAAIDAADRVAEQAERVRVEAVRAVAHAGDEVTRLREELARAERTKETAHAAFEQATAEAQATRSAVGKLETPQRAAAAVSEPELPADPTEELEQVRARIAAAETVQKSVQPWEAWERAQAEEAEASERVAALSGEMAALEDQERALIASAGIPVEGLGFAENGGPILNGRPLAVASGAERIRLAVGVALAANPDLRIALVDEANDMDLDGLQALDELARAHGFQVWAARIGLEGPGEIVVEEGTARARAAEPVAV